MGRIMIFTGKGGVGKTSVAASHALKAAKEGKKTLIVSTDMAHNLSDLFQKALGKEPVEVYPKLEALEIDPNYEMERHYGTIKNAFQKMMFNMENVASQMEEMEDITVIPGFEELFSLIKIQEMNETGAYDLIVVDCAPTGETLSLLKFPELFSWYMEKLFPIGKVGIKLFRPISKKMFKIEMPDNKAMNDIEVLYIQLSKLQQMLRDRESCSIRLVTIPEKMVVEETKRNYMYLNLYNFNVDGVFINRIIPEEVQEDFFKAWKAIQAHHIEELEEIFQGIPIYKIRWYDKDIVGIEGLEKVVEESLKDKDLLKVLEVKQNEIFEKTNEGYSLSLYIPFAKKEGLDLVETTTDLVIKVGNFKRNIPLPLVLRKYQVGKAKWQEDQLIIFFEERSEA
ncbi:MAG: ArsA family ATPase [Cellulosilyticum sp.]|nr:ArsA family ATPase [Cellulosilyticum sp.]